MNGIILRTQKKMSWMQRDDIKYNETERHTSNLDFLGKLITVGYNTSKKRSKNQMKIN